MSTDREAQVEELNVIESIYPDILCFDGERRIRLNFDETIKLTVDLPEDYPSSSPPVFLLSGPSLNTEQRRDLLNRLNEAYAENIGSPILFNWISIINDFLQTIPIDESVDEDSVIEEEIQDSEQTECHLKIHHGEVFSDRKSHFQAHLCRISSKEEVQLILRKLLENNKIARATHNIYAWRLNAVKDGRVCRMHDCEDDGETGASSKMLDLLDKMGAENIIVIVTRWYGGIHLGPDRFRHINNLTREIVAEHGLDNRLSNNNRITLPVRTEQKLFSKEKCYVAAELCSSDCTALAEHFVFPCRLRGIPGSRLLGF